LSCSSQQKIFLDREERSPAERRKEEKNGDDQREEERIGEER
jgi:hypothetical protein